MKYAAAGVTRSLLAALMSGNGSVLSKVLRVTSKSSVTSNPVRATRLCIRMRVYAFKSEFLRRYLSPNSVS